MAGKKVLLGMILCVTALLLVACDGLGRPDPTPTATVAVTVVTPTTLATPVMVATPVTPVTPIASGTSGTSGTPTVSTRPTAPAGWTAKVTYEKSGGIAGIKQTLLVGPAGQARLIEGSKNSGPVKLTAEKLSLLKQKLDATDFFNLKDHYGTGTVADDFILTLSVMEEGRTKTVTVEQIGGKDVTPQALLDFIAELDKLQGEIEARPTPTLMSTAVP